MKRILPSIALIVATLGALLGGTTAFFSDSESSVANTFTAGAIDLKVDNESYYNLNMCTEVTPGVWQWQGTASYPVVGSSCTTSWNLDDLDKGHLFFDFRDVKPDDEGEDTISLHVQNDAYACLDITLTSNDDVSSNEPELGAGDVADVDADTFDGELAQSIEMYWWADDGDNVYEVGERGLMDGVESLLDLAYTQGTFSVALADAGNNAWGTPGPIPANVTTYIAKAWCFGTLTPAPLPNTAETGPQVRGTGFTCNGEELGNMTQTDEATLDVRFRTEQARHNGKFLCNPETEIRTGTLVIQKVINGGETVPEDFSFTVDGGSEIQFDVDGTNEMIVAAGPHTVAEVLVDDYVASYSNSADAETDCTNLSVPAGGSVTCTITNTFTPLSGTLTVTKVIEGGDAVADDFSFTVNGGAESAFEVDGTNVLVLAPGQYSVVESTIVSDYTPSYANSANSSTNCTDLTVTAGQNVTCTVTNTYVPPTPTTLTITKSVVGGDAVAGDFSYTLDGNPTTLGMHSISAGPHTVGEAADPHYVPSFGDSCDQNGNVTAVANTNVTCSITNTYDPTRIIIEKIVEGGTAVAGDFTFQIDSNNAVLGANVVTPGAHSVQEVGGPANYSATYSGDCNANGGITAVAHEDRTCTVTNTFIPPTGTLSITKFVVGGPFEGQPQNFSFQIDGGSATAFDADSTSTVVVNTGTYDVTESAVTDYVTSYWNGTSATCNDLVVTQNGTTNCWITNTYVPPTPTTITITKSVVGGTATTGSFTYRIDGNAVPLNTANVVTAGAHTVTETGGPANYVATFGGSCNGAGQITAVANTNVTCTITNTFVPPTPTSLFVDGFGTGNTDTTFNETPTWTEGGAGADKRNSTGGGDESISDGDGGRKAAMIGTNGYICRTMTTTGYNSLVLAYQWRGDTDAESGDNGIVEYATGGTCASPTGLTNLATHSLTTTTWQNNSINLPPALNNTTFLLRFRVSSSQSNEDFRVDGVSLTGVAI